MPEAAVPEAPRTPAAPPSHAERSAELINALWNDGDIGAALRKKAKEKYPDLVLPEETFNPVIAPLQKALETTSAELAALRKEREEEKKANEEAALNRSFEEAVAKARRDYSLTDEGFEKMIERMKATKNYTDADAAAAWVVSKEPPPPAPGPTWGPQNASIFGGQASQADEKMRKLLTDPQGYADAELNEFIANPDAYVASTFGRAA